MKTKQLFASRLSMTMAALALAVVLPLPAAMAADEHYVKDGAAVGGYDVVAYHKAGAPTMGSSKFTAEHQPP
jgi:opacity protein-like surface antigen